MITLARISFAMIFISFGVSTAHAQQFRLCTGEYYQSAGKCGAYDIYAYCGQHEAEAKRICTELNYKGKPKLARLKSVPGNKCGYTLLLVECKE